MTSRRLHLWDFESYRSIKKAKEIGNVLYYKNYFYFEILPGKNNVLLVETHL